MAIRFSLITGETLELKPGMPEYYSGPLIRGAVISHATATFGHIILQQVNTEHTSFRKLLIHWKKPEGIICHYNHQPGLFTRTVLDNPLHEFIKGAGELHLHKEQFALLAGGDWKGLLMAEKPGEHIFYDTAWSAAFLQDLLTDDPALSDTVKNIYPGYPERLAGPPHPITNAMKQILHDLQYADHSTPASIDILHKQMRKYFRLVYNESKDNTETKKHIKTANWDLIDNARRLIDENPDKHLPYRR